MATVIYVAPRNWKSSAPSFILFTLVLFAMSTRVVNSFVQRTAALRPAARSTAVDTRSASALPLFARVSGYTQSGAPTYHALTGSSNVLSSSPMETKTGAEVLAQLEADIARNRTVSVQPLQPRPTHTSCNCAHSELSTTVVNHRTRWLRLSFLCAHPAARSTTKKNLPHKNLRDESKPAGSEM